MNKNIKLAVAGAVLALTSQANAGIIIPAGDWTLDVNGNVNTYATWTKGKGSNTAASGGIAMPAQTHDDQTQSINTGLLPAWLGFTGTTRQNDVDVSFTISMQPNVSENAVAGDDVSPKWRQTFLTFGDKSWGSVKLGKDIGLFASEAILNDMTLLGVGGNSANSGAKTTLGGIGTGYIYAAWKGQATYSTPNFNGFQASVGITNPNQFDDTVAQSVYQDRFGLEGKASYSFSGDALNGKVWVSGLSYDVTHNTNGASFTASAADIGANVNAGNLGVTAYYYSGEGVGTTTLGSYSHSSGTKRDSDGGYAQLTYILPTKTKLGLAYGVSNLDRATSTDTTYVAKNERITVGLYHPLTKHLNLVAEYNDIESRVHNGTKGESQAGSLGAILFF